MKKRIGVGSACKGETCCRARKNVTLLTAEVGVCGEKYITAEKKGLYNARRLGKDLKFLYNLGKSF